MKSQNEDRKLTEAQTKSRKPRFKIEKLEERIATVILKHTGPHGGAGPGGNRGHCCVRC